MWIALGIAIILGALGQVFMKMGMKTAGPIPLEDGTLELFYYFLKAILSPWLVFAVASYGISFFLWLGALSVADLSLIRPFTSLGYIVTMAYGYFAGESMTPGRVAGTLLIVAGLFFLIRSAETSG